LMTITRCLRRRCRAWAGYRSSRSRPSRAILARITCGIDQVCSESRACSRRPPCARPSPTTSPRPHARRSRRHSSSHSRTTLTRARRALRTTIRARRCQTLVHHRRCICFHCTVLSSSRKFDLSSPFLLPYLLNICGFRRRVVPLNMANLGIYRRTPLVRGSLHILLLTPYSKCPLYLRNPWKITFRTAFRPFRNWLLLQNLCLP